MNVNIVYMLVTLLATSIGAIAGLGGGVIIKPVFDVIGFHDPQTIGAYSAFAVFTMAIVSTYKQIRNRVKIDKKIGLFISLGSLVGGYLGDVCFEYINSNLGAGISVDRIQAGLLFIILLLILIYTLNKDKFPSYKSESAGIIFGVGFFLGIISIFLGIGGGPLNVATLTIAFSFDLKDTVVYSIITILAAQISKLGKIFLVNGIENYNLDSLVFVIVSAVLGGYLGAIINNKLEERKIEKIYIATIIALMLISIYNTTNLQII
ncbi:MAG TPA: sulfite exporter TauE/SafE family protein [Tepidimicrobium sp.]|nr:sulfite exporter TauE/SafE family protein [Tepidimicrobium sp.]